MFKNVFVKLYIFSDLDVLKEQMLKKDEQIENLTDLVSSLLKQLSEANSTALRHQAWSSGPGNI